MAKSIFTDGVWAIMHFNSSFEAYLAACELHPFDFECCYCHRKMVLEAPLNPGESQVIQCNQCEKQVEYLILNMSKETAAYFDARGGTLSGSPLAIGGIMHIALPTDHPEFDTLIVALSKGKSVWVSPSESSYFLLDFISRVINMVAERFNSESRERVAQEVHFQDAQNILNLSQSFTDFGRLVSPRPVAYPPAIKLKRDRMITSAANELEQLLLSKYSPRLSEDDRQEIKYCLLQVCAEFVKRQWVEKIAALSSESRSVYSYTYRDYQTCLFKDSEQMERTTSQVLTNCEGALASFSQFIIEQFIETSGLVSHLPYAVVEQIKKAIENGVLEGARLYVSVAYLHDKAIPYRPNLDALTMYTSFANDVEVIDSLLGRYDVRPIVEARTHIWFNALLTNLPELLGYPYRETDLVRTYISTAIRNAYLLCLVYCE